MVTAKPATASGCCRPTSSCPGAGRRPATRRSRRRGPEPLDEATAVSCSDGSRAQETKHRATGQGHRERLRFRACDIGCGIESSRSQGRRRTSPSSHEDARRPMRQSVQAHPGLRHNQAAAELWIPARRARAAAAACALRRTSASSTVRTWPSRSTIRPSMATRLVSCPRAE